MKIMASRKTTANFEKLGKFTSIARVVYIRKNKKT